MIFSPLNIKKELTKHRESQEVLDNVNELLASATKSDTDILNRLKNSSAQSNLTIENKTDVFTLQQIRHICIRYRLRFLESVHFKSEYPYEAILKIKAFEKMNDVKIESFSIIAPENA